MNGCQEHEIELSSLLDGESSAAAMVRTLDHLVGCPACRGFYAELRSFQERVDSLAPLSPGEGLSTTPADPFPVVSPAVAPASAGKRRLPGGARPIRLPRWAWGAAATLILTLSLAGAHWLPARRQAPRPERGETLTVRLEEDAGQMSDRRFLQLTTELLRADRRYREMMGRVLDDVRVMVPEEEAPAAPTTSRSEGAAWEDRAEALPKGEGRRPPD